MRGLEQIPWVYDTCCAIVERSWLGQWRRWVTSGARGRTLDLGCGTGRNLPLVPAGTRAIGLDLSWPSLKRARRRAPGVPLVLGSAEALPFREGTFDTVLSGLALCSVAHAPGALAEVRRVLRPGGQLRALEHVRSTTPWKARLQDLVQPAWTCLTGGCRPNRDTERTVEDAGFRIEPDRQASGHLRRFSAREIFPTTAR